jgi:hypothetical protein
MNNTKQSAIIKIGIGIATAVLVVIIITLYVLQQNNGDDTSTQPEQITENPTDITGEEDSDETIVYEMRRTDRKMDENPFEVVSTSPADEAVGISPELEAITLTMSEDITEDDIQVFVAPITEHTVSVDGSTVTVAFEETLLEATTYSYSVQNSRLNSVPFTYSFTTVGPTPTPLPDTRDPDIFSEVQEYNKQNAPELYLISNVPYETDDFFIDFNFVLNEETDEERIFFVVTLKGDEDQSRQAFLNWLSSIDLTPEQIEELDIEYETE